MLAVTETVFITEAEQRDVCVSRGIINTLYSLAMCLFAKSVIDHLQYVCEVYEEKRNC